MYKNLQKHAKTGTKGVKNWTCMRYENHTHTHMSIMSAAAYCPTCTNLKITCKILCNKRWPLSFTANLLGR